MDSNIFFCFILQHWQRKKPLQLRIESTTWYPYKPLHNTHCPQTLSSKARQSWSLFVSTNNLRPTVTAWWALLPTKLICRITDQLLTDKRFSLWSHRTRSTKSSQDNNAVHLVWKFRPSSASRLPNLQERFNYSWLLRGCCLYDGCNGRKFASKLTKKKKKDTERPYNTVKMEDKLSCIGG